MRFLPHQIGVAEQLTPTGKQCVISAGFGHGIRDVLDWYIAAHPALVVAPLVLHRIWSNYDEITTPQMFIHRQPKEFEERLVVIDELTWRNARSASARLMLTLARQIPNVIVYRHQYGSIFDSELFRNIHVKEMS